MNSLVLSFFVQFCLYNPLKCLSCYKDIYIGVIWSIVKSQKVYKYCVLFYLRTCIMVATKLLWLCFFSWSHRDDDSSSLLLQPHYTLFHKVDETIKRKNIGKVKLNVYPEPTTFILHHLCFHFVDYNDCDKLKQCKKKELKEIK